MRYNPHERRILDQTQFTCVSSSQMDAYEVKVKTVQLMDHLLIAPGVGSPNQRRYDQGSAAVIWMAMATKSHFDARSRHTFETNEHCLSEKISSCSWPIISLVRFGATRIATVAVRDDLRTIIKRREVGERCVDGHKWPGFYVPAFQRD